MILYFLMGTSIVKRRIAATRVRGVKGVKSHYKRGQKRHFIGLNPDRQVLKRFFEEPRTNCVRGLKRTLRGTFAPPEVRLVGETLARSPSVKFYFFGFLNAKEGYLWIYIFYCVSVVHFDGKSDKIQPIR